MYKMHNYLEGSGRCARKKKSQVQSFPIYPFCMFIHSTFSCLRKKKAPFAENSHHRSPTTTFHHLRPHISSPAVPSIFQWSHSLWRTGLPPLVHTLAIISVWEKSRFQFQFLRSRYIYHNNISHRDSRQTMGMGMGFKVCCGET